MDDVILAVRTDKDTKSKINQFCHEHGYTRSRWMLKLALQEIERMKLVNSGHTQIDPAFFQGGRA